MSRPRHAGHLAAALGAVAMVAAAGILAWRHAGPARGDAAGPPIVDAPRALPAAVPRLAWRPVVGAAPGSIAGFATFGDTVVALDPRAHRVVLLRPDPDGAGDAAAPLRVVGEWGRRGGGPGELREPAALARAGADQVAIVDAGGRVRRFDLAGRLVATDAERGGCPAFAPDVAYASDGRAFVSGHCAGAPPAADTIYAVVHELRDGRAVERTRTPRMALDASWGSSVGTLHPLADLDSAVLFAPGLDACAVRLDAPGGRADDPAGAARRCDLVRERLRADEPASVARDRRAAEARGDARLARLLRWPDPLPAWLAIVSSPDGPLLLRPVSGDSLLAVPAGRPFAAAEARLAAPLRHLVGCARGACLWYDGERLALWRPAPSRRGAP